MNENQDSKSIYHIIHAEVGSKASKDGAKIRKSRERHQIIEPYTPSPIMTASFPYEEL